MEDEGRGQRIGAIWGMGDGGWGMGDGGDRGIGYSIGR